MFDIGWTELLVIGVVALIVVGPKDLPLMFRALGRFTGKARGMARDFQRAMDQAADEAGVKDVSKTLRNVADPKSMGTDALKDAAKGWTSSASFADSKYAPKKAEMTEERERTAELIRKAAAEKAEDRIAKEASADADKEASADADVTGQPNATVQPEEQTK